MNACRATRRQASPTSHVRRKVPKSVKYSESSRKNGKRSGDKGRAGKGSPHCPQPSQTGGTMSMEKQPHGRTPRVPVRHRQFSQRSTGAGRRVQADCSWDRNRGGPGKFFTPRTAAQQVPRHRRLVEHIAVDSSRRQSKFATCPSDLGPSLDLL